jgi:RNA polymerase sigma-70 factor (ECF subfamily)
MIVDVTLGSSLALGRDIGDLDPAAARVTQAEFESFYRETALPLWRYLRRICGDRALADDLLQETYLRFCRARVPGDRSGWRPYLYRIGTNLAADWWRHAGRRAATVSLDSEPAPAGAAPDGEAAAIRRGEVDRAFAVLKPRERALLWLAYVEELDHREIAKALGLSRASVKVLLFRARRKILEIFERRGIGPEVLS